MHISGPFQSARNITKYHEINDEIYIYLYSIIVSYVYLHMRLFKICLEISAPSCRAKDLHLRQVRHAAGLTREFLRQKRFDEFDKFGNTFFTKKKSNANYVFAILCVNHIWNQDIESKAMKVSV